MTVLVTPLVEVAGSLCTALLAIDVGRLIELDATFNLGSSTYAPKISVR